MTGADAQQRRFSRERRARQEAESILEQRSAELFQANQELLHLTNSLEERVAARTSELKKARDVATEATDAKSRFLATMSHEIRTPLTAVLGCAEILAEELADNQSAFSRLADLRRNAEHLSNLLGGILDFSRIEAGQTSISWTWFAPAELLHEIARLMRLRADERNLTLDLECATDLPSLVQLDVVKLRQVLWNLIDNAIKYTTSGGVVVTSSCRRSDNKTILMIEVRDTGCGIATEDLDRIFDPYAQTQHYGSRRGVGLGLGIARQFVQLFEGTLDVESRLGEGSTFRVSLPLKSEQIRGGSTEQGAEAGADAPHDDDTQDRGSLEGRHILIADDFDINYEIQAHAVINAGAQVARAHHGREAIDQVQRAATEGRPFDAILMDVRMPVMDGLEAVRRLRAKGHDLPIAVVTADVTTDVHRDAVAAGCSAVLTKPITRRDLVGALRSLLGSPAAPSAHRDAAGLPEHLKASYRAQMASQAKRLRAAVEVGDWDTVKTIAHQVAGTGTSYGFPELSELGSQLQRLSGDAGDGDRAAAAEALIRALAATGQQ